MVGSISPRPDSCSQAGPSPHQVPTLCRAPSSFSPQLREEGPVPVFTPQATPLEGQDQHSPWVDPWPSVGSPWALLEL